MFVFGYNSLFYPTGPAINSVVENSEEPQPSLSDLHDFEPKLEFDDTELLSPPPMQSVYLIYLNQNCGHLIFN